mgnify:CR=1 FL=1
MAELPVIVEVLSESTEAYDRGEKLERYRQFTSLAEYILVNPPSIRQKSFGGTPRPIGCFMNMAETMRCLSQALS